MTSKEELNRCTDEQLDKVIDALGIVFSNGDKMTRDDKIMMIIANANEDRIKILLEEICCKE